MANRHLLISIKYFNPRAAQKTLQTPELRDRFLGFVNSITSSRLPTPLANHLRDGIARAKVVATHLQTLASTASSPLEMEALSRGASSMLANVPVYPSVSLEGLRERHPALDADAAAIAHDFVKGGHAERGVAAVLREHWPDASADTRCELRSADGAYPPILGHSAGKGGERRLHNDIERTFLERFQAYWWRAEHTPGSTGGANEAAELEHVVSMLNAVRTWVGFIA